VVAAMMLLVWLLSLAKRDASIVDPFWGIGFVLAVVSSVWLSLPPCPRDILLLLLTTIWGLRLSFFLCWRNWGHGEDRRYRAMRDYHGPRFWWVSLFTVFMLQALILWFVSFPIQVAAAVGNEIQPLGWLDALGVVLWAIGFTFEAVGDWQLARFKADPRNAGRVMAGGLWKFTRHPNYFGDCCVWWAIYLIAAAGGAWWTIGSPLLMTVLLLRVSGVTLLEKTIVERRPDYAAYKARTNAFFPGPPRRARRQTPDRCRPNDLRKWR
jgi:steroid 5-alpha reductase family enzyme